MNFDAVMDKSLVFGIPIHIGNIEDVVSILLEWASDRRSRYVGICNVHMTVTANESPILMEALHRADLVVPDGAPVAWVMRRQGVRSQRRVCGPDLMWLLLGKAAARSIPVTVYGGRPEVLEALAVRVSQQFPGIRAQYIAPEFGLSAEAEETHLRNIREFHPGFVFVALGCPKQELWMAAHRGAVPGVMLGIGAAIDFHSGEVRRAPGWMRSLGFEWLHRLASEPKRLWRRYWHTNSRFLGYLIFRK